MSDTSIMIVGVGGQGTLLASKLIGAVAMSGGFDVKVSEVHGMSQRGGSVVTYVRYGQKVASPIIEKGEADYILAFEELEAARYLPYLKKGGLMLVNSRQIDPMPVITGAAVYPQELTAKIQAAGANIEGIDALEIAQQAGNTKAVNVVMIGLLAKHISAPREHWEQAIRATVPQRFYEQNLQAFMASYQK